MDSRGAYSSSDHADENESAHHSCRDADDQFCKNRRRVNDLFDTREVLMKRSPVRYLWNEMKHFCGTNFNVNTECKSMQEHEKQPEKMPKHGLKVFWKQTTESIWRNSHATKVQSTKVSLPPPPPLHYQFLGTSPAQSCQG